MRIRPGRTRSVFVGILVLLVTLFGLTMMGRASGMPGPGMGPFVIMWVIFGLAGSAMAFYNAFSEKGLPLYEVDVGRRQEGDGSSAFCPQCGRSVAADDQFCRRCGAPLDE